MERPTLVGDILEQWKKHANAAGKPRSTIIFACNVAHSRHIVNVFRHAGISAEHLDGQVPEKDREAILDRLAGGQTSIVSNVLLLSEGFDCPPVSCIVIARPTASRTLFIQMVGRALRPCPAKGKTDCVILDHAGNAFRHGLISEITCYELEAGDTLDLSKEPRAACKKCPSCYAVVQQNAQVCPECNYSFSLGRKLPDSAEGELVEVQASSTRPEATPHFTAVEQPSNQRKIVLQPNARSVIDSFLAEVHGSSAEAYRQLLLDLKRGDVRSRLVALRPMLFRLPTAEKMAFIKAGLFSPHPDLWLEEMTRSGCLKPLGLSCIERVYTVHSGGHKGLTCFQRMTKALRRSKPDLTMRLATIFYAVGVPDIVERANKHGFRTIRGYASVSANVATKALINLGVVGELRECTVELIAHHEYLFDQILNYTNSNPISKLCQRWRKKLGPLWRRHFEFAECLWEGSVLCATSSHFSATQPFVPDVLCGSGRCLNASWRVDKGRLPKHDNPCSEISVSRSLLCYCLDSPPWWPAPSSTWPTGWTAEAPLAFPSSCWASSLPTDAVPSPPGSALPGSKTTSALTTPSSAPSASSSTTWPSAWCSRSSPCWAPNACCWASMIRRRHAGAPRLRALACITIPALAPQTRTTSTATTGSSWPPWASTQSAAPWPCPCRRSSTSARPMWPNCLPTAAGPSTPNWSWPPSSCTGSNPGWTASSRNTGWWSMAVTPKSRS